MDLAGRITNVYRDFKTQKWNMLIELEWFPNNEEFDGLLGKLLDVVLKVHKERRSLNANALLWKCLGDIAKEMTVRGAPTDKWDVYLDMLKHYGKYTYICVPPKAVNDMKKQWREVEVIGDIDINGRTATQLLCYFGSSTYDTKEFSVLLDGVIAEMINLGLTPPMPKDLEIALEQWEKTQGGKNGNRTDTARQN